ncbi:MAG TPA: hypothetical protein VI094_10335 [Propionibacteriaceae bacterium]
MTEVIIGLDVGTTAVKVAAFGVNGAERELASALRGYRLQQPPAGWQVHDPASALSGIDSALAELHRFGASARVVVLEASPPAHLLISSGPPSRASACNFLQSWTPSTLLLPCNVTDPLAAVGGPPRTRAPRPWL